MADKPLFDNEVHELKFGKSFDEDGGVFFHEICYDFKPASIDKTKPSVIDVEEGNKVRVTVPNVEGASSKETVFCGSKQPVQKDFILVINHDTGEYVLERLTYMLKLKRTRAERTKDVMPMPAKQTRRSSQTLSDNKTAADTPATDTKPWLRTRASKSPANASVSVASATVSAAQGSSSVKVVKSEAQQSVVKKESLSSSDSSSSDDDDASAKSDDLKNKPVLRSSSHSMKSVSGFNVCDDLRLSESSGDNSSDDE